MISNPFVFHPKLKLEMKSLQVAAAFLLFLFSGNVITFIIYLDIFCFPCKSKPTYTNGIIITS